MILNTPEETKNTPIFQGLEVIYATLIKDLEKMGCAVFVSKWSTVDPDKHEVMTQVRGPAGIIVDEFVKGYMIGERVLRHAKVVVGQGE